MRLHAVGGLCNRLRAVLSYRALHRDLEVLWRPDEYVSGVRFEDVFDPLEGVRFLSVAAGWDVEDYAPAKDAPEDWEKSYGDLVPVGFLGQRIADTIEGLRGTGSLDYTAIHVRRTDHAAAVAFRGEALDPLGAYLDFAGPGPLYLATDNRETQTWFRAHRLVYVSAVLRGEQAQDLHDHRRNGTLADAVVDLYVCSMASRFMGTRDSSFTDTIHALRRLYG